jgi:aminoglycoside phosphotransferase family enzyme/predicted kinase
VSIPAEQRETAAFLRGLAGREPVETHISAVYIGTGTVWKLKKAVRLAFLDFSELPARHRFLLRELAVNRAAAPELYRDVVPVIRQPDGTLALGDGQPTGSDVAAGSDVVARSDVVDWVLRMAPVPMADFLDTIAAQHGLTPALRDALADTVSAYHHTLPPVPGVDSPAAMRAVAQGNAIAAHNAGLPDDRVRAWVTTITARIAEITAWLATRAANGFVRRAHGDLHLGNLCLWRGRPVPFDAIEFDEAMATIDVGYDLAFLLMDLDHRVARGAANRVLNRYVARTGDAALTRGLPVFLSMRAMIRAQVEANRGNRDVAAAYLDRTFAYLAASMPMAPPMVIAIGGLPGTGKSTLARALAPMLGAAPGALVLRSDEIRKRQHGVAPEQRLPESAYTSAASDAVFAELAAQISVVAEAGHAVIADAMFLRPEQRASVAQAAAGAGVPFLGLWLTAPTDLLQARLASRTGDASDATVAVLQSVTENDRGGGDWLTIDARDGAQALALARQALQMRNGSHGEQEPC